MVGHDAFDYVSSTPGRQRTSSTSSTSSMASLATINSYTEQSSVRLRTGRHSFSSASSLSHMPSPAARPFRRKTLVLDLDETLIHSTSRGSRQYDCMIEVAVEGHHCLYYVYKRPHVDFFLQKVAEWYRVVVFTASLPEYADPVIDFLDGGKGWVSGRYFRSSCISAEGTFLKDLTVVDRNLAQVILVDNSPMSYALNQANGIPIEGWISDQKDEALLDLLPFLDALRFTEDGRDHEQPNHRNNANPDRVAMPKKQFIDRKQARHYQVVHRSQRDPLISQEDASQYVLKPVPPSGNLRKLLEKDPDALPNPYQVEDNLKSYFDTGEFGSGSEGDFDDEDLYSDDGEGDQEGQFDDVSEQEDTESPKVPDAGAPESNAGQAALYGVYFDDRQYDYTQHLKDVGAPGAVLIDARPAAKDKRAAGVQFRDDNAALPAEALPSQRELSVGLMNQAAQPDGLAVDLPEDVREVLFALDDDAYVDDELDDGFFAAINSDSTAPELIPDISDHDLSSDADSDVDSSEDDDRQTVTSMTSSVLPRTEQLQLLDSRFDALLAKEYDSEEEDEDDEESTATRPGAAEQLAYMESLMDEFLTKHSVNSHAKLTENLETQGGGAGQYDIVRRMLRTQEDGTALELDLRKYEYSEVVRAEDNDDDNDNTAAYDGLVDEDTVSQLGVLPDSRKEAAIMERVVVGAGARHDRWDCETIVSTYSNLENHPRMISERRRRPVEEQARIVLSAKTGMPVQQSSVPTSIERSAEDEDIADVDDQLSRVNLGSARDKCESKEDKRARKQALKDDKRVRKMEKKAVKQAFKQEAGRQSRQAVAKNLNTPGLVLD
ncbi:Protein ltv1 [Sorochytrium milnesiophthora]